MLLSPLKKYFHNQKIFLNLQSKLEIWCKLSFDKYFTKQTNCLAQPFISISWVNTNMYSKDFSIWVTEEVQAFLLVGCFAYPAWASLVAQMVKNLPAMQETRVWSLSQEDPLEKGMATHCSILARRTPGTEGPDGLQSMGLQRVRHDWLTLWIFSLADCCGLRWNNCLWSRYNA